VKKSAVELHRLFIEAYSEAALKRAVTDFDISKVVIFIEDKERARRPKLVEDAELEALLDENPCQTQEKLAESLELLKQPFPCV